MNNSTSLELCPQHKKPISIITLSVPNTAPPISFVLRLPRQPPFPRHHPHLSPLLPPLQSQSMVLPTTRFAAPFSMVLLCLVMLLLVALQITPVHAQFNANANDNDICCKNGSVTDPTDSSPTPRKRCCAEGFFEEANSSSPGVRCCQGKGNNGNCCTYEYVNNRGRCCAVGSKPNYNLGGRCCNNPSATNPLACGSAQELACDNSEKQDAFGNCCKNSSYLSNGWDYPLTAFHSRCCPPSATDADSSTKSCCDGKGNQKLCCPAKQTLGLGCSLQCCPPPMVVSSTLDTCCVVATVPSSTPSLTPCCPLEQVVKDGTSATCCPAGTTPDSQPVDGFVVATQCCKNESCCAPSRLDKEGKCCSTDDVLDASKTCCPVGSSIIVANGNRQCCAPGSQPSESSRECCPISGSGQGCCAASQQLDDGTCCKSDEIPTNDNKKCCDKKKVDGSDRCCDGERDSLDENKMCCASSNQVTIGQKDYCCPAGSKPNGLKTQCCPTSGGPCCSPLQMDNDGHCCASPNQLVSDGECCDKDRIFTVPAIAPNAEPRRPTDCCENDDSRAVFSSPAVQNPDGCCSGSQVYFEYRLRLGFPPGWIPRCCVGGFHPTDWNQSIRGFTECCPDDSTFYPDGTPAELGKPKCCRGLTFPPVPAQPTTPTGFVDSQGAIDYYKKCCPQPLVVTVPAAGEKPSYRDCCPVLSFPNKATGKCCELFDLDTCCTADQMTSFGHCCPAGSTPKGGECCFPDLAGVFPSNPLCCPPSQANPIKNKCCPDGQRPDDAGECCARPIPDFNNRHTLTCCESSSLEPVTVGKKQFCCDSNHVTSDGHCCKTGTAVDETNPSQCCLQPMPALRPEPPMCCPADRLYEPTPGNVECCPEGKIASNPNSDGIETQCCLSELIDVDDKCCAASTPAGEQSVDSKGTCCLTVLQAPIPMDPFARYPAVQCCPTNGEWHVNKDDLCSGPCGQKCRPDQIQVAPNGIPYCPDSPQVEDPNGECCLALVNGYCPVEPTQPSCSRKQTRDINIEGIVSRGRTIVQLD